MKAINICICMILQVWILLVELDAWPSSTLQTSVPSLNLYSIDVLQPSLPPKKLFLGASALKNRNLDFSIRQPEHSLQVVIAKKKSKDDNQDVSPILENSQGDDVNKEKADEPSSIADTNERIFIWKIEEENQFEQRDLTDYTEFRSENCYMVAKKSKDGLRIHYWIGKLSSDDDAGDAAISTVVLDFQVHATIRIQRETEGEETSSFKALFKNAYNDGTENDSDVQTFKPFNVNERKIFLFKGKNQLSLRKVKFSLDYLLQNKNCLVVVSKKVFLSCGSDAPERQKQGANALAEIILEKKGLPAEDMSQINITKTEITKEDESVDSSEEFIEELRHSTKSQMKQTYEGREANYARYLVTSKIEAAGVVSVSGPKYCLMVVDAHLQKIFHRIHVQLPNMKEITMPVMPSEFKPAEMRRVLAQTTLIKGKEYFNFDAYRVYDANQLYPGAIRTKKIPQDSLQLDTFNIHECCIIDSCSNAGLFVWMGAEASLNVRAETARQAELFVRKIKYNHAIPITFIDQKDVMPTLSNVQELVSFLASKNDEERPMYKMSSLV